MTAFSTRYPSGHHQASRLVESAALEWINNRTWGLAVSPFSREGITRASLALIKEFIGRDVNESAA